MSERGQIRDRPWDEGYEAGYTGKHQKTNPYDGTARLYWFKGFADGTGARQRMEQARRKKRLQP